MLNRRFVVLVVIPAIACGLMAVVSLLSHKVTLHIARTFGSSHFQFTCAGGRLILIHNAQWWRVEHFGCALEETSYGSPVDWPGFFEETRNGRFGFEYARGDYLTAFTCVGKDTKFIPPFKPVAAGTMLRVSRKFKMFVIPIWCLVVSAGFVPAIAIWLRTRLWSKIRSPRP